MCNCSSSILLVIIFTVANGFHSGSLYTDNLGENQWARNSWLPVASTWVSLRKPVVCRATPYGFSTNATH